MSTPVSGMRTSVVGFTAIELVVTLAILGIVLALGLPSFKSVLLDQKQSTQLENLRKSLVFARSEAIKRAQHVSVCARSTDTACGTDWSAGWLVYTDADSGTPDTLDSNDLVLRLTSLSAGKIKVAASAIVRPAPIQAQTNIRFSPRGRANWSLGTLVLCDPRGEKHAKGLVVNGAGSLRAAYADANSGNVVRDAMGNTVGCA